MDRPPVRWRRWLAAGGLLVAVAGALWASARDTAPSGPLPPPENSRAPSREPERTLPVPAPQDAGRRSSSIAIPIRSDARVPPEPGDPFATAMFDGEAVELLNDARLRVSRGARMPASMKLALYRYGKEHPEDARPQLLLAFEETRLEWWRAAIGHYERALAADPRTRSNPKVLPDLLRMISTRERDRAAEAIRKHYGGEAKPAIEAAIRAAGAAGQNHRVEQLESLRKSL